MFAALSRGRRRRQLRVDLFKQSFHELRLIGLVNSVDHPASSTADPASADVENVDGGVEFIGGEGEDIRVGPIVEDRVLLEDRFNRGNIVSKVSSCFIVEFLGRFFHSLTQVTDNGAGLSFHELAQ